MFWSDSELVPLRKNRFIVSVGDGDFDFQAKTVTKPVLETDVNEYRLINQINKFPTVPRWSDITIKYVETENVEVTQALMSLMLGRETSSSWKAGAITKRTAAGSGLAQGKSSEISIMIIQYGTNSDVRSIWKLKNPFIKSIDYGDNDYSSDDLIEVTVVVSYDWAYLE